MTGTILIAYLLNKKPFEGRFENWAAISEELMIIFLIYHVLCFTNWITDPDVRQDLGKNFIALVMSIMIVYHSFGLIRFCKKMKRKLYIKNQSEIAKKVRTEKKFSNYVENTKVLRRS